MKYQKEYLNSLSNNQLEDLLRRKKPTSMASHVAHFGAKALTSAAMDLPNASKKVRQYNQEYEIKHPKASRAADIVGTIGSLAAPGGLLKAGSKMLIKAGLKKASQGAAKGLIKQAAKEGAIYGAGKEVGTSLKNEERENLGSKALQGASKGAALGAAAGTVGKIAAPHLSKALKSETVKNISDKLGLNKVVNKVRRGIEGQSKREAYQNFEKKLDKHTLDQVKRSKAGDTLLDTKNEHARGLADSLSHSDTKSRQIISNRLDSLRQGQKKHLEDITDRHLGKRSVEDLQARHSKHAQSNYEKAYREHGVKVGDYAKGSPMFNREVSNIVKNSNKTKNLRPDSVETLDLANRNLRSTQFSQAAKPHQKIEAGKVADELSKSLKAHSSAYAKASKHAKSEIDVRNAHKLGESFQKSTPGELAKNLNTSHKKYAAAQGAKGEIKRQILNKNVDSNIAKSVFDDDAMKKLSSIIGEKRAKSLRDKVSGHATKFENFSSLRSGSKTAEHESNKGIFAQAYKATKRPAQAAVRLIDKVAGKGLHPELKASTQTKYLMHPEKLKQAMKKYKYGKYGMNHSHYGMLAYKGDE
jgi:hypothetical protein